MTTDQQIGERVHQLMWRLRLKQTEVAPLMGLTQSGLSRKMRGVRSWSLDELLQISEILKVPATELLPPEMAAKLLAQAISDNGVTEDIAHVQSSDDSAAVILFPQVGAAQCLTSRPGHAAATVPRSVAVHLHESSNEPLEAA